MNIIKNIKIYVEIIKLKIVSLNYINCIIYKNRKRKEIIEVTEFQILPQVRKFPD